MNAKPIVQLDLQGNIVKRHKSLYHLCLETEFDRAGVKRVLKKKRGTAGGYIFIYEKEFIRDNRRVVDNQLQGSTAT